MPPGWEPAEPQGWEPAPAPAPPPQPPTTEPGPRGPSPLPAVLIDTKSLLWAAAGLAGIGALLVLVFDFGGQYWTSARWDSFAESYFYEGHYYYYHLTNGPLEFFTLAAIAGVLSASCGLAIRGALAPGDIPKPQLLLGTLLAGVGLGLVIILAVVFAILGSFEDEWWLDVGFFGGFLGSLGAGALQLTVLTRMGGSNPSLPGWARASPPRGP